MGQDQNGYRADDHRGMTVSPRPAATLVLFRDAPSGDGEPEVLMVERHGRSNFGAGAFVFPGGVLEPEDCGASAERLSQGLTGEEAAQVMASTIESDQALGIHIAAIRETFEETLVLLAESTNGPTPISDTPHHTQLVEARENLEGKASTFFDWLNDLGMVLPTGKLVYFAHWITPEGLPIRFSTYFFACRVPENTDVHIDDNEVVHHLWGAPSELLGKQKRGDLKLMDPTIRNLEVLAGFSTTDEALETLRQRTVTTIQPKVQTRQDGSRDIIYPWDKAYHAS